MDTQFLKTVLPENEGWFYVVRIQEPSTDPNERPRHKAIPVNSPSKGEWTANKHNADHGIFFTPFTFNTDYEDTEHGKRNVRRLDEKKLTCRAFWIDLDIGDEPDKYPDKRTALHELMAACSETMPNPTLLVDSGGGVHAYWVLDEALPLERWRPAAERFKQYFVDSGLKFDRKCTADPARVMRLPGTNNMKTGEARPCKRLDYLGAYVSTGWIPHWPEPTVSTVETNIKSLFSSGDTLTNTEYTPKYTAEIVKNCNVFAKIASDHGARCNEPLWKDVLQTVALTQDGDEWAHKLSDGHPGYDPKATDMKMAERKHGKGILCSTFADHFHGADPCAGCPMKGKGHSPLSVGFKPDEAPGNQIDHLACQPEELLLTDKGVYRKMEDKDGNPQRPRRLSASVLYEVEAMTKTEFGSDTAYLRIKHQSGPRVTTRVLDLSTATSQSEMHGELMRAGLLVSIEKAKELGGCLMNWYNELKSAGAATEYSTRQGWIKQDGKIVGFSHGPNIFRTDGSVDSSGLSANTEGEIEFIPRGELAKWTEAANYLLDNGNLGHASILATAFAAPLVELAGAAGIPAVMSYYCTGGTGKSTAMRFARSVWAVSDTSIYAEASTVAAQNYLHRQPNLPLYWDEPRTDKTREALREFLFSVTSGMSKTKAKRSGAGLQETFRMHTMAACASNQSLSAEVTAKTGQAEGKRFLEVRMDPLTNPPSQSETVFRAIETNYAVAGAAFMSYVVRNVDTVRDTIDKLRVQVKKLVAGNSEDRFYVNAITLLVVGATIAKREGIVNFDPSAMLYYLVDVVNSTKAAVTEALRDQTAAEEVMWYLRDKDVFGWTIAEFPAKNNGKNMEVVAPTGHLAQSMQTWSYLVAGKEGLVRVDRRHFKEWYNKNHASKINWTNWVDKAKAEGIWTEVPDKGRRSLRVNGRSFSGCSRVYCFEVVVPELADNPLKVYTDKVSTVETSSQDSV